MRLLVTVSVFCLVAAPVAAFVSQSMPTAMPRSTPPRRRLDMMMADPRMEQHDDPVVSAERRIFCWTAAAVGMASIAAVPWTALAAAADDDDNAVAAPPPLHKVDYPIAGKCGQADGVPESAVFFVKQFGGFRDGACATEGYAVADGTANGTGDKDKERVYHIYAKE